MGVLGNNYPLTPLLANPPGGAAPAPNVPLPYGSDPFAGTPSSLGQVNPVGPAPEEVAGQLLGGQPPPPLAAGTPAPLRTMNEALLAGAQYGMPGVGMFAGPRAVGADMQMLAQAKEMAGYGIHPNDIWFKTGWFQGADGMWRFEIPDIGMTHDLNLAKYTTSTPRTVGDAVRHPDLFNAYPDLANLEFAATPRGGGLYTGNMITVGMQSPDPRGTILHELQHGVQEREGFAPGANTYGLKMSTPAWDLYKERIQAIQTPLSYEEFSRQAGYDGPAPAKDYEHYLRLIKKPPMNVISAAQEYAVQEAYRRSAGEVEARNVSGRAAKDLYNVPPASTEDVPRELQIVTPRRVYGYESNPQKMTPEQFQRLIDYMRSVQGSR